ncbi:hypothetical protein ACFL34_01100 [Candidatus Sumerlaeota bacterium]
MADANRGHAGQLLMMVRMPDEGWKVKAIESAIQSGVLFVLTAARLAT